ncbi:hypothetical protein [Nitrosopumilus sp.]|uniref:hypothetical protein n=1 Tax=Nitrosopumilus sp. TaxID=2024843 RepID=UPI002637CA7A|nr:hypothetical protein [Nitrosopumilus sp.]
MDYSKLGDSIFEISSTVRFVEIYHKDNKYCHVRKDMTPLLEETETEQSIEDALDRWKTRIRLSEKLGAPKYAMAEYGKVKRITIPFNENGLILVSLDCEGFHEVVLKEILEIINSFSKEK